MTSLTGTLKDFRSRDGLYALLNRGDDEALASRVDAAGDAQAESEKETGKEEQYVKRRSSRIRTTSARRVQFDAELQIADPQEIFDINIFRSDPQIF